MATPIIGIPTTRISEAFVRERMLNQVMYDHEQLFRVQRQLSTGRRFEAPSTDPVAAMRVVVLQQLLSRKSQMQANISTNLSFLSATDHALSNVAGMVAEARGAAIAALGTTATDVQRRAAAQQIEQVIRQLMDTGNYRFRGRYLFAGSSDSTPPFSLAGTGCIEYLGNETRLSSFADISLLFDSNITGTEVFGAVSAAVRGTATLTPVLTYDTKLADLFGGAGVSLGSIEISDGTNRSIVDLSGAVTLGDLAAKIKANPPAGRALNVHITDKTLYIRFAQPEGANLSIRDVGGGTTAYQLGILRDTGVGEGYIESRELQPALTPTTLLENILGAKATAFLHSAGRDNDLVIRAAVPGEQTAAGVALNGVQISLIHDNTISVGNEFVEYTPGERLVIHIVQNYSRAYHVRDAINRAFALGQIPFYAELDPLEALNNGDGVIDARATAVTANGWGEALDKDSGLQIVNRQDTTTINFSRAQTIEDLLNLLNGAGAGLMASINADRNGIDVRSRVSGCDFMIGENGGKTASQLGLRTFSQEIRLEQLNHGNGVDTLPAYNPQYAEAVFDSGVPNSRIRFRARQLGADWNGFRIELAHTADPPSFQYDPLGKKMTFYINEGTTTANDILAIFAAQAPPEARNDWELTLPNNSDGSTNNGTGLVAAGTVATDGGDDAGVEFYIYRTDGVRLGIDISGAVTVGDVIARINNHINNVDGKLVAALSRYGNGIQLTDSSLGNQPLRVVRNPLSTAAIDLGLVPRGADSASVPAVPGESVALTGRDVNPLETESIFTALLRIKEGLLANDMQLVQRGVEMLDTTRTNMDFARAEVGARQQALASIQDAQEAEHTTIRKAISDDYDAELEAVVSELTARQAAYQAALIAMGKIFQMSLLNYL